MRHELSEIRQMLNGAIVGLGYISGKGHLPAYLMMKDVRIVAVACRV